jgi:hypothetical protein
MSVVTAAANAASQIAGAISRAARATGASFEYLLTTAQIESNLNPKAQAPTSSAKGLYQFIDQTWLATLKRAGPTLGLGGYADAIVATPDGRYAVPDPAARTAIMKLRSDPAVSAMVAGAFTRSNAAELANGIGRQPTEGELYIAHFLGPDGASRLISAAARDPRASAPALFPQAAAANRSIFYHSSGSARSVREVYGKITSRFEAARSVAFRPGLRGTLAAQDTASSDIFGTPARKAPDVIGAQVGTPPDTAGVAQALAQASSGLPPQQAPQPLFRSMFSDPAPGAVNRTVSALWTPATAKTPAAGEPSRPLNLFTDGPGDPRALFRGS